jgi:hypothetical protein
MQKGLIPAIATLQRRALKVLPRVKSSLVLRIPSSITGKVLACAKHFYLMMNNSMRTSRVALATLAVLQPDFGLLTERNASRIRFYYSNEMLR